jgi:protein O-mannosyl-transferase
MAEKKKAQKPSNKKSSDLSGNKASFWFSLTPVLILTFILYSGTLKNYFIINWDDDGYIINNPMIKNLSWKSIIFMFSHFHLDNYHPLTTLTNAIEYKVFKLNPIPYHFNNLLLHLLNTALVFHFVRQLIKNKQAALLASLLFAVHPMHVESVAWISERKDLLYTPFFLLSLITYNHFIENGEKKQLVWSVIFMLFSCLSKPAAVALTPILFLLDYYAGKKISARSILIKTPFLILSLSFGIIALLSQSKSGSMDMVQHSPVQDKFFFVFYGLSFYIIKLFAPVHLSSMYLYPVKDSGGFPIEYYLAPLLILFLIILIFRFKRIRRELVFGFLFYFFTIAMVIQVVPVGKAIVAERYSYVPYIGLFFIVAKIYLMVMNNELSNSAKIKPILNFSILFFIACFCFTTWNRNKDWKDSESLFTSVIKQQPDSYYGYYARGVGRSLQNNVNGTVEDYTAAITRDSTIDFLWYNRGVELEKINKKDQAEIDYTQAIKLNPNNSKSFYNRGNIKILSGNLKGAIEDYTKTIQIDPTLAEAFCNRAVANLNLGDTTKALEDFTSSLARNPKLVNALYFRANVYIARKNFDLACEDYFSAAKAGSPDAQKLYDFYCKKQK